jgi:hypothetical protein
MFEDLATFISDHGQNGFRLCHAIIYRGAEFPEVGLIIVQDPDRLRA